MASCHQCVAATRGFLRCKSAAGTLVLHVGLLFIVGALICSAYMILRSTKLLTTYSNLTATTLAKMTSPTCDSDAARYSMSFVSINDTEKAESLAKQLVDKRLAACVQIIPQITSIYSWEGKTQVDKELLMIIKSRVSRLNELTKFIVEHHPYTVCEVTSVPMLHGNPEYLKWLGNHVPDIPDTGTA